MLAAFLTTILFSMSAVSGSRSARLVGGTEANFWRLIVATLFLGVFAYGWSVGLDSVAFPLLFVSGCIGFGFGDATYFQALTRIGARLSTMMVLCLSSPVAALVEWIWLGTGLSIGEILAAMVILVGVGIALAPSGLAHLPRRELVVGMLFGGTAALCQAAGAVLSRKAYQLAWDASEAVNGITIAFQRILGGVLVMALLLLVVKRRSLLRLFRGATENPNHLTRRKAQWRKARPWILLNGLAGPALGVSCFQWALISAPSGIVLPIVSVTPIVVIPFSFLIEGERPSRRSLTGGLLAVAGAVALAWTRAF